MNTRLQDIFEKPVDRPIDGVIKADDDASLHIEFDEYVITAEIKRCLEEFLDAYNNYENANGVWISGFFGSGKSHLLKILAHLLQNRTVDGRSPLRIFESKLTDEPMLVGALRKAVSIPSRSILFNIDQKADVISKSDRDALLAVFQKVFDESCGYYGKQAHIAQFERDMDKRGKLDEFKEAYLSCAGQAWEHGREQAILETENISSAYATVTGAQQDDSINILDQYRRDTQISIEDFANQISFWLDTQEPNLRLNFFVDEVGQYIADNVKLMTNLQTIAESLNTKCRGRAWLIVTAQQEISAVVGEISEQQENDFSKIQARFNTRMPLNSADVAEVIQKRLLSKTEAARIQLGTLYDREENNLKTLFEFTDGSIQLKSFRGRDHFISSYPFPGYQYDLFQRAIQGLSTHNAFEGRHRSVGERSMLGVFQDVAKSQTGGSIGSIITFDLMFDGLKPALKSAVQQSLQIADKNLGDEWSKRLLKCLFLVKYVREFRATVRNLRILLLSDFEADQMTLRGKIEQALSNLEKNSLIECDGEIYHFLTDEEKDVENEIKSQDVDLTELSAIIGELVFGEILVVRKIKHEMTNYEYAFSRKLDDSLLGREQELTIRVFSPLVDTNIDIVRMRSMNSDELVVAIPDDVDFVKDLKLWKQTEKYIRQSGLDSIQPERTRIISEKIEQNRRRYRDLETRLRTLICNADLCVRGEDIILRGADASERIQKAFQTLVDKVYVNLPMLKGINYAETDLGAVFDSNGSLLPKVDDPLTEAEQDVFNFIQNRAGKGLRVSVRSLLDSRKKKPYGWPDMAILCIVATLSAKSKIEVRSDSSVLKAESLVAALNNSREHGSVLLAPQAEYTAAQLRKAKDLYQDLFGVPARSSDAQTLGVEWSEAMHKLVVEMDGLTSQESDYPFMAALLPFRDRIRAMIDKSPSWMITEPVKQEQELLEAKENILEKIRNFMGGSQRRIYDEAREYQERHETNIGFVDPAAGTFIQDILVDLEVYEGSSIQNLKANFHTLKEKVELKLVEERQSVLSALDECAKKVGQVPEFQSLASAKQQQIVQQIEDQKNEADAEWQIAVLRDLKRRVDSEILPAALAAVDLQAKPDAQQNPRNYVHVRDIKVTFSKTYLSREEDVDAYLAEVRTSYLAMLRDGKKLAV